MILIALGANIAGTQGTPLHTLPWAVRELAKRQLSVESVSSFYRTIAVGQQDQPDYLNAIACVQTPMSSTNLLNNLKDIEKKAGRSNGKMKTSGRWGTRPLDLDIVDYKGLVSKNFSLTADNVDGNERLILPHPRAHERPFVIRPILDIDPFWHHPVLGFSASSLWSRLQRKAEGAVLSKVV